MTRDMTPKQSVVARALLGWSRVDLAGKTRGAVSERTITNLETGARDPHSATLEALKRIYTSAGISFDPDGVNVRLNPKPKRKG